MNALKRFALFQITLFCSVASAQVGRTAGSATLAAGVPLRIRVKRTVALRKGAEVSGILTEPVYVHDRLALPRDTEVRGVVAGFAPVDRKLRTQALLNGDITPLHEPVVDFDRLRIGGSATEIPFSSRGTVRETQLVRFLAARKHPSWFRQAADALHARATAGYDVFFTPGRKDRALRLLYGQLPYHPQRIWAGTTFVADLSLPLEVPIPESAPVPLSTSTSLDAITVSARLITPLNSKTSKPGDPVRATVTQPVFDADHKLLVPEGATLEGSVTRTRAARSLGRNGELRFGFRGLSDEERTAHIYGNVTGAAGAESQNITVDEEGDVKANPDKGRLIAPLLLAYTAALGHDDDGGVGQSVVGSNGFGLVARFVALANNKNVVAGFGAYALAKSVYFRYLDRGHEVSFPRDTEVEVQLVSRSDQRTHSDGVIDKLNPSE
jgi:hypothetical protein